MCVYAWDLSSRGLNRFRWKNSTIESIIIIIIIIFFKGNCRSRKIFVRVVSFSSSMEVAKGENLWEWRWNNRWCGFVTIEETRMKKRGNETTKLTENKDNKDFN